MAGPLAGKTAPIVTAPWWQTGVVYQIYPRSFRDADGDGVGDLDGILERIDYLSSTLGVDAVWLSPFYPSPMDDFGYDVADYCDVDPLFGDLNGFDRLLDAVHQRGIKMIVDLVPNHTSDRHPWFRSSRTSRTDPKRDWYVWADPGPDGSPPNNWLAAFGGVAWEWDEYTGQYYLHSFLPSQPDLNWRNPEVEAAMFAVMRFWLDRGVDGFRIDVAHFIMKDPLMRDNPPAVPTGDGFKDMADYGTQEHIHDKGHPDIHPLFRRLRALLDGYTPPRVAVGEIHIDDLHEWVGYYGTDGDELHLPFNFRMLYAGWDAAVFRGLVDELEEALPDGAWPNYVLGNHDEPRLATRFGPRRAGVAAMLLLTLRGTPTLYYGDELGMTEAEIPPERRVDPWGLRVPGLGRDGCRTPMAWDDDANAGFTDGTPWLPMSPGAGARSVAVQLADPLSMLSLYRALLGVRREMPSLNRGSYRPLDVPGGCFAYRREAPGAVPVTVALNFTGSPLEVEVGAGRIAVSTGMIRNGEAVIRPVTLGPDEGVVVIHPARDQSAAGSNRP
jgi:glycosidase